MHSELEDGAFFFRGDRQLFEEVLVGVNVDGGERRLVVDAKRVEGELAGDDGQSEAELGVDWRGERWQEVPTKLSS